MQVEVPGHVVAHVRRALEGLVVTHWRRPLLPEEVRVLRIVGRGPPGPRAQDARDEGGIVARAHAVLQRLALRLARRGLAGHRSGNWRGRNLKTNHSGRFNCSSICWSIGWLYCIVCVACEAFSTASY